METLNWLTELMESAGGGNTTDDDLELCDESFVFKQLLDPHGRVEQGFLNLLGRVLRWALTIVSVH